MSADESDPGADAPARSSPPPVPAVARPARHTLREFGFQLATITAGVLIALSVDGVLELGRQRNLVREAHAAIALEIQANLRDLEGNLPAIDEHRRYLSQALRFANDLTRTGKTDVHELRFALDMASLTRASWQTAERTGALGYMDYATVQEYSELYDLQDFVVDSQRRLVERIWDLSAITLGGEGGDPTRLSPRDLEVFRLRVLDSTGVASLHYQLAEQLVAAYRQVSAR